MIVQAIVNVGLLFAWSCMCLMKTLDDCDVQKKLSISPVSMTLHTLSIKVQQSRSRYAKYNHPVSFMLHKQCEELAFPVLFPKGRYEHSSG